jgi:hypothetical protein
MPTSRSARSSRRLSLLLGNRLSAETVDLSAGGFSVEAPFVFMPGALLDGAFEVEGRELAFQGEVVWARPASESQEPSRMGVRFTEFPSEGTYSLLGR